MVSKVEPGQSTLLRMSVYRAFERIGVARSSYAAKFAVAAFAGILVPLSIFILYLLLTRSDLARMYPVLAALMLASIAGFLGMLWLLQELLAPVDLTVEALRDYIDRRRLPDLPIGFPDRAGRLMEGTQYTLAQLDATIERLERSPDTDDLTGLYNRRAGERRLNEEVARAERDLHGFHLACFDVRELGSINEIHGHSAGDACITHAAAILQLGVRRGDWIARWGNGRFMVGMYRNAAVRPVVERLLKAIEATPAEVAPGVEVALRVACGVSEYRFGTGSAGLLADVEHALERAKEMAQLGGGSGVSIRGEVEGA